MQSLWPLWKRPNCQLQHKLQHAYFYKQDVPPSTWKACIHYTVKEEPRTILDLNGISLLGSLDNLLRFTL